MTGTQIKCFLEAAENLSFSKAAGALFLAQSAVSRQIIGLEKELDTQLFIRSGKKISLTGEGRDYYDFFVRAKNELSAIRDSHRAKRGGGTLSLRYAAFPVWNITELLYENAAAIQERHPQWELTMKFCGASAILSELRLGNVDVIFHVAEALEGVRGLRISPLGEVPYIIIYSDRHPLAGRAPLTLADFRDETFLYVPDETLTEEAVEKLYRGLDERYGFSPRRRRVEDIDALSMMLESCGGVALMDYWSRPKQNKRMRYISTDMRERVVMACSESSKNPAVGPFISESRDFFESQI